MPTDRENAERRRQELEVRKVELLGAVVRGDRVRAFLKSDFWLLDLEPLLVKEQNDSLVGGRWSPASEQKSCDLVALTGAYCSGISAMIERIELTISRLANEGESAEVELKRLKDLEEKS